MSKNKKTRIAKGLGAGTLAVATLASGLSFGAASASAAPSGAAPFYFTADESATNGGYPGVDGRLPVMTSRGQIYSIDTSETGHVWLRTHSSLANAEQAASKMVYSGGKLMVGSWCLVAERGGSSVYSMTLLQPCNDSRYDPGVKFDADGRIIMNAFGHNIPLAYGYVSPNDNNTYLMLNKSGTATAEGQFASKKLSAVGAFGSNLQQRATISGVAEKGATVVIKAGSAEVGRVVADANDGSYSWDVPAPNQGGTKAFTVSQIVSGSESGNVSVSLDYGTAVSVTSPSDQSEQPAGSTTISGRGERDSSVTVKVNGQALPATTVASNGTWSVEGELRRGENRIEATQASKGANTTTSSITVNPGGTAVPAPGAEVVFGAAVTDKARVEGTAENGATVTIKNAAGTVLGSPQVVDGRFSLPITSPGAGEHEFTVTQTIDGETSEPITVSGDFGAAVAVTKLPAQVTPGDQAISGTGENGRTVTVKVGSQTKTAVVANGRWSVEFELRPSNTAAQVSVSQTAQGNTITTGTTTTTPNGAIAPRPVTIDEPSSHMYTPMEQTTLSGTATPYAMVKIETTRGGLIREVQADKNGQWSFNRAYGPSNVYTFVATQTRFDGTTSKSGEFIMSPIDAFRALTVTSHADGGTYTAGSNTFTGTATPDAMVRITNQWGRQIASAQASPVSGAWTATGNLGPTAEYTLTFTQTAPNAQQDHLSMGLTSDKPAWKDAALTSPTNNSTYRPGSVTFTGTGAEGTAIVAKNQWGTLIGKATVGADGTWAFDRNLGPTADYQITFTATRGTDSNTFTANVNAPKFAPLVLTSPQDGDTYTPGQQVTFTGKSSPFATIEVKTKRGGAVATAEANDKGEWSFKRAFGPTNTYEMVFTQTDVYGAVQDTIEFDYAPNAE